MLKDEIIDVILASSEQIAAVPLVVLQTTQRVVQSGYGVAIALLRIR